MTQVPLDVTLKLFDSAAALASVDPTHHLSAHFASAAQAQGVPVTADFAHAVVVHAFPELASPAPVLRPASGLLLPAVPAAGHPLVPVAIPWKRPVQEPWHAYWIQRQAPARSPWTGTWPGGKIWTVGLVFTALVIEASPAGVPAFAMGLLGGLITALVATARPALSSDAAAVAYDNRPACLATMTRDEVEQARAVPGLLPILAAIATSGVPYHKSDEREVTRLLAKAPSGVPPRPLTTAEEAAYQMLLAYLGALKPCALADWNVCRRAMQAA